MQSVTESDIEELIIDHEDSDDQTLRKRYHDAIQNLTSPFLRYGLKKTLANSSVEAFEDTAIDNIKNWYFALLVARWVAVFLTFGLVLLVDYIIQRIQHDSLLGWKKAKPFLSMDTYHDTAIRHIHAVKIYKNGEVNTTNMLFHFLKHNRDIFHTMIKHLYVIDIHRLRVSCRTFYYYFRQSEALCLYTNPDLSYSKLYPIRFDQHHAYTFTHEGSVTYSLFNNDSHEYVFYDNDHTEISRLSINEDTKTKLLLQYHQNQLISLVLSHDNTDAFKTLQITHFTPQGEKLFQHHYDLSNFTHAITKDTSYHEFWNLQARGSQHYLYYTNKLMLIYNEQAIKTPNDGQAFAMALSHNGLSARFLNEDQNTLMKNTFTGKCGSLGKLLHSKEKKFTFTCVAASRQGYLLGLYYSWPAIKLLVLSEKPRWYRHQIGGIGRNPNELPCPYSRNWQKNSRRKPFYHHNKIAISQNGQYAAIMINHLCINVFDLFSGRIIKKFRTTNMRRKIDRGLKGYSQSSLFLTQPAIYPEPRLWNFPLPKHNPDLGTHITPTKLVNCSILDFHFVNNHELVVTFTAMPPNLRDNDTRPLQPGIGFAQYARYSFLNSKVSQLDPALVNSDPTTRDHRDDLPSVIGI